jgi:lipopolysaccharide export system protein LptA
MKTTSPLLRVAAVLSIWLPHQPCMAAPPQPVTAAESAAIAADAISKSPEVSAANAAARTRLETDLADSAATSKAVAEFLVQAELPAVPPAAGAAEKPLEVKNGPNDTVINSSGGMYFDADAGVLVYLKDVTVNDPRYNLTGADELKIFFAKKPVEPKKEDAAPAPGNPTAAKDPGLGDDIDAKFGDVERIVATGAVVLDQKAAPGKEPLKASGRIFTYNLKDGVVIISRGFPWFTQGTTYMRAKEENLSLKIFPKTGSFTTEGNWEMGGELEKKKEAP